MPPEWAKQKAGCGCGPNFDYNWHAQQPWDAKADKQQSAIKFQSGQE
jgi:hypothetical protein